MKIIDEKGRLFGKINIIDFLIILFLLFLVPASFFGYKLSYRYKQIKDSASGKEEAAIKKEAFFDFWCRLLNLTPEEVNLIFAGDKVIDSGKTIAEILLLNPPEDDVYHIDIGKGKTIDFADANRRTILAKIRLFGEIRGNTFYCRGSKVSLDSKIPFSTDKYEVQAVIIAISENAGAAENEEKQGNGSRFEPVELNISLKPVDPDKVELISAGDIFLDNNGNKIGEILNIGAQGTYTYNIDLGEGNVVSRQDPALRQVAIRARLLGEIRDNLFYWQGVKVIIGSKFNFETGEYSIEGTLDSDPNPA